MKSYDKLSIEEQAAWSLAYLKSGKPVTFAVAEKLRGNSEFWSKAYKQMTTAALIASANYCAKNIFPQQGTYTESMVKDFLSEFIKRLKQANKNRP